MTMQGGTGIFGKWQPVYAEAGLAAFPVDPIAKKPMVSNYMKVGVRACDRFAQRFGDAPALGIGCKRSRLTVLDVDTPDERILADALDRHGPTPIIVRSGSGHFHAWYRSGGEKRAVKPDPDSPIDILGDGFIVAPPSQGAKGGYEFISGSLADLAALPRIIMPEVTAAPANDLTPPENLEPCSAEVGKRNEALFKACLHGARTSGSLEELLAHAVGVNAAFPDPLPSEEVATVAQNAWRYQIDGKNRVGQEQAVQLSRSEVMTLVAKPDAFVLLSLLRLHNWNRPTFIVANEMARTMPPAGWPRKRFAAARADLMQLGFLQQVRAPSQAKGAAIYRFT
jgi:hypothetical protein